ncbi:MAG TPA: adenylosuccinate lyase, partial [Microbacterium sp.]|nr:adenylosuccinate lyase [Microbacterium sp.]
LAEAAGGASSAMPQKQNPVESVLIRSVALRAPGLGSTLHLAAALAADERPDGAWHAEWATLRELLRLALGATAHAASLAAGLRFDGEAAARNLAADDGLILAERLSLVLEPLLGRSTVASVVAGVGGGADLGDVLRRHVADAALDVDVDALLDAAGYTGVAATFVDDTVREPGEEDAR